MEIFGFAAGPYKTNCYLVMNDGQVTVIDPGMYSSSQVEDLIREHDLDVDKIVLTHGHVDHTRDAGELARRFSAPVFIHPDDRFMLSAYPASNSDMALLFDAKNMIPISDLRDLVDGSTLSLSGIEFRIAHAPGHSPGSTLLVGEDYCFSGDVLFKGTIGRTDLEGSVPADMTASLRDVVLPLPDSLQVLPGHGPITTMRSERISNPFLQNLG